MATTFPAPVTCTRHGRQWRVEWSGRAAHVRHGVGMLHLAVLIANPAVEISALDLVAGVAGLTGTAELPERSAERARLAVGRAIRRALASVEAAEPVVGAHLRGAVRTGAYCCYRPGWYAR
jgi:hypothetical protein